MAIHKLAQYQIIGTDKNIDCHIQAHACHDPEILAIGASRYKAVSLELLFHKKSHSIGFMPDFAYWHAIPLIEKVFNTAYELGKNAQISRYAERGYLPE